MPGFDARLVGKAYAPRCRIFSTSRRDCYSSTDEHATAADPLLQPPAGAFLDPLEVRFSSSTSSGCCRRLFLEQSLLRLQQTGCFLCTQEILVLHCSRCARRPLPGTRTRSPRCRPAAAGTAPPEVWCAGARLDQLLFTERPLHQRRGAPRRTGRLMPAASVSVHSTHSAASSRTVPRPRGGTSAAARRRGGLPRPAAAPAQLRSAPCGH